MNSHDFDQALNDAMKKHENDAPSNPITREELIARCSPPWTATSNEDGLPNIRLDDVVQLMSICSGILAQYLDQRIDPSGTKSKLRISGGGDDTHFDYIPCALGNVSNIISLYLGYGIEPDEDNKEATFEEIKKDARLKDEDIYFQDEDMLDELEMEIYRKYSTLAGGDWTEYDEMQAECAD